MHSNKPQLNSKIQHRIVSRSYHDNMKESKIIRHQNPLEYEASIEHLHRFRLECRLHH